MSSSGSTTEPDTPTQVNLQLIYEARLYHETPHIRRQRQGIEIDLHRRCYIYVLREYGHWTIRKMSRILHIPHSTVHCICQRGPNNFTPRYRSGRPSFLTPETRRR